MNTVFNTAKVANLLEQTKFSQNIIILSHTNPDGDALGSGLGLLLFLRKALPKANIRFFVPNSYPEFLKWVDPGKNIEIFKENHDQGVKFLAAADTIFVVDFNQPTRLESISDAFVANTTAVKILIDHHIAPPNDYQFSFHTTLASSASYLVYKLIEAWGGTDAITLEIANALYLGMMTDTGSFSYGNLTADLFRTAAVLVEKGVDPTAIHLAVFNNQSESRLRMVGYLLSNKLVVDHTHKAAYVTLTHEDKDRFNHQIGDTEGIVNIPLSISGIEFSAIMIETKHGIKISLRSVGDLDVNILCREHFNGGGHKNAAGGKFDGTMEQAITEIEALISTFER